MDCEEQAEIEVTGWCASSFLYCKRGLRGCRSLAEVRLRRLVEMPRVCGVVARFLNACDSKLPRASQARVRAVLLEFMSGDGPFVLDELTAAAPRWTAGASTRCGLHGWLGDDKKRPRRGSRAERRVHALVGLLTDRIVVFASLVAPVWRL